MAAWGPQSRTVGGDRALASLGRMGGKGTQTVVAPAWWEPPWDRGSDQDPDAGWPDVDVSDSAWHADATADSFDDDAILAPMEAQFGQVRSRERVRDLAEVFTHQREVDAMLDLMPDAFHNIDVKFLEPACGSGNFLVEILRRKLRLVH